MFNMVVVVEAGVDACWDTVVATSLLYTLKSCCAAPEGQGFGIRPINNLGPEPASYPGSRKHFYASSRLGEVIG